MNISYDLIGNYTNFSLFVQLLLKVFFKHFFHWSLNRLYSQSSFNEVMSVHPFISTCPQGHWEDWAEFTHCMSPALLLWKEGRKTHFEFRFALSTHCRACVDQYTESASVFCSGPSFVRVNRDMSHSPDSHSLLSASSQLNLMEVDSVRGSLFVLLCCVGLAGARTPLGCSSADSGDVYRCMKSWTTPWSRCERMTCDCNKSPTHGTVTWTGRNAVLITIMIILRWLKMRPSGACLFTLFQIA